MSVWKEFWVSDCSCLGSQGDTVPLAAVLLQCVQHFIPRLSHVVAACPRIRRRHIHVLGSVLAPCFCLACDGRFPALNVVAILLDAITIGMYYGYAGSNSFNTFMCIVNLLLRPITSLVLLRFYNERAGRFSAINFPGLPGFGTTGFTDRASYEDLERTRLGPHQSIPTHHQQPEASPTDVLTK